MALFSNPSRVIGSGTILFYATISVVATATFIMCGKGTGVIFLVLPAERVVVFDREKGDRGPAIVLRADGTINFYEDGQYISTGLDELSVADINPEVRRKMAETIDSVPVPKGFRRFAARLRDMLCAEALPEQEAPPHSEHWPFANTLR